MSEVWTVSEVLSHRVRRYREGLGWSQERLADETRALGHPLGRVTIARIEAVSTARRKGKPTPTRVDNISLVDALVLAVALNVPPPLLFLPLGEEERVALTPTMKLHPHLALDWITGEGPLVQEEDQKAISLDTWHRHAQPMWLFQELRRVSDACGAADHAASTKKGPGRRAAIDRFDDALRELRRHLEYMERAGLRVPDMPRRWADRLAELRTEGEF